MPANEELNQVNEVIDHGATGPTATLNTDSKLRRVTPRLGPKGATKTGASGASGPFYQIGAAGGIAFRDHNDHTLVEAATGAFKASGPHDSSLNSTTGVWSGTVDDDAEQDLPDVALGETAYGGAPGDTEDSTLHALTSITGSGATGAVSVSFTARADVSTVDLYLYKTIVDVVTPATSGASGTVFPYGAFDPDDFVTAQNEGGAPDQTDVDDGHGEGAFVSATADYTSTSAVTVDAGTYLAVLVPVLAEGGTGPFTGIGLIEQVLVTAL